MSPVLRRKDSTSGQPHQRGSCLPEEGPAFTQTDSKRSSIHGQSRKPQPCLPEDEPYFTAEDETSEVSLGNELYA